MFWLPLCLIIRNPSGVKFLTRITSSATFRGIARPSWTRKEALIWLGFPSHHFPHLLCQYHHPYNLYFLLLNPFCLINVLIYLMSFCLGLSYFQAICSIRWQSFFPISDALGLGHTIALVGPWSYILFTTPYDGFVDDGCLESKINDFRNKH